jgi:serine phosphatase RsbU (regulator of sigma subunit)
VRRTRSPLLVALAAFAVVAFGIALLAIVDLALPKPWDGVVLEADAPGTLMVSAVVGGSGAHRAGIRPGDRIVGIDRGLLRSPIHAAELLGRRRIGETVPYLVRRDGEVEEVRVELGRRHLAGPAYFYAALLGMLFFAVGSFVLLRQPRLRAAQVFFLVCVLFLLFLVCRLRPPSYSLVDRFLLSTGTFALLFLPACFLHFFLIFPEPIPLRPRAGEADYPARRRRWMTLLVGIYLLPPVALAAGLFHAAWRGETVRLISGVPVAAWWLMAFFMACGLAALAAGYRRVRDARLRRGVALILIGSVAGLVPFLVTAVTAPEALTSDRLAPWGLALLGLVPITFAIAIVRFGLLDIRVMLRRSLAYSVLTAGVTLLYAGGIALFNRVTAGTALAASPWFPVVFALAIALLFDPLRRRSQGLVDGALFGERARLQEAMRELTEAFGARVDLQSVVRDLVERLPELLDLRFAALYLVREGRLVRVAGPENLPEQLPDEAELHELVAQRGRLARVAELAAPGVETPGAAPLLARLAADGVEWIGDLSSTRRRIGFAVFSGPRGQLILDGEEVGLLGALLGQAALALEAGLLVEERTRQAELERELEIASAIQAELLPHSLSLGAGWRVAAACRPARHVGGDFFAELPGPRPGAGALVFGDVAGKSVSGALMMMAAHEALQSLAFTHRDPATLLTVANQRLYRLGGKKGFVAIAWIAVSEDGTGIDYALAGQPQLLVRGAAGAVRELPLPEHRLPLGALLNNGYQVCRAAVAPGEVVLGYSDGVIEAQSPSGEQFGDRRLAEVLRGLSGEPQAVVDGVLAAVRQFAGEAEPYDDITLVAIARDREEAPCVASS